MAVELETGAGGGGMEKKRKKRVKLEMSDEAGEMLSNFEAMFSTWIQLCL